MSPSPDNVKIVTNFLLENGVKEENIRVSKYRDLVFTSMSVSIAENLFRTEFALFRSVSRRDLAITRITKPYYLPSEVAAVVSLVDEILRFPSIRNSQRVYGSEGASSDASFNSCGTPCAGFTTPEVLQEAYSFSPVTSVAPGNSVSVAEFQYQYC